ncbi:MAG: hypothetical protein NC200_01400 [Candidatus Gastranaerophilales bacterium]|nr:hypothetical protein [Candidatus Gastranaerophilales bacterium]
MKKWLPIFISVVIITINVLAADASENVLRGVNVKSTPNAYTIELTSTNPARMTKNIVSTNRIIINLKDVKISSNLSTRFDGNAVVDNIIVEPNGLGNANILIQGDNIAYSNVEFKAPSTVETVEDSVTTSFASLFSLLTGSKGTNRAIQFATLLIFGVILIGEIKFIKSKYDELNEEKRLMQKDIDYTVDFKEYTSGYGNAGIKKPYTTPVYGSARKTSNIRANYLQRMRTSETATLNMLMHSENQENQIIDKIVNNKPVFGSLSNISIKDALKPDSTIMSMPVSNPMDNAKLKDSMRHLEAMSKLYRQEANMSDADKELKTRLNELY